MNYHQSIRILRTTVGLRLPLREALPIVTCVLVTDVVVDVIQKGAAVNFQSTIFMLNMTDITGHTVKFRPH